MSDRDMIAGPTGIIRETTIGDAINQPPHYTAGLVECIDAIKASMTAEEYAGYLKGNCLKYLLRYRDKGGVEDLKKCRWYLDKLIGEGKA